MSDIQQQWPSHYSAADVAAVTNILAWLAERSYSQAALARLAKVSASSLNQIIKGGYSTPPSTLLLKINSAMRNADQASTDAVKTIETGVLNLGMVCFKNARRYRNFAVFTGFVGIGKTYAIKYYLSTHGNTYVVEAAPTMSANSLVKRLSRLVLGYEVKGSIDDKFNAVIDALKNTDSLVIIDEAETLTPHQLHTLRRLRDLANIGIVLCGTEYLTALIKPLHGQFDQIRSRCGFWPETIQAISLEDSAALIQSCFGAEEVPEAVINRLHAYSSGSARMLVEGFLAGIKNYRNGNALSVKLVDAVAKQVLCLQPLE